MRYKNSNIQRYSAMTLLEVVISISIMTFIFTALLPITRIMQNSWDSKRGSAETIQNERILNDHLTRNLSRAAKITAVSNFEETNGFIEFQDNDGNTMRYDVNNSCIEFGPVGDLSELANSVSKLQFTCYEISDLDTPITDINDVSNIRFVKAEATLTNSAAMAQDKIVSASAFIYTNANAFAPESSDDPNLVAHYEFEGNYINSVTGLPADPCGPTIEIISDPNHPERGQILSTYTQGVNAKNKVVGVTADHVNCGNQDVAHIETAITIACWEKLNDPNGIFKGGAVVAGKSYPWKLMANSTTQVTFAMSQIEPLGVNPVSTTNVFDGQWHHLVGVYDGTVQSLYVDGQLEDYELKTGTINIWDGYTFLIGSETNKLASFPGFIDDVRIYDRALDANDVLALYNNQEPQGSEDPNSMTLQILP